MAERDASVRGPLAAYLVLVALLSGTFVVVMGLMGEKGLYLAQAYMLLPAVSAAIARGVFYPQRFRDAKLAIGPLGSYVRWWAASVAIMAAYTGVLAATGIA